MLKKTHVGLFCATMMSFICSSYADTTQLSQATATTIEYELVPHVPQLFTNYLFWRIDATCVINTEDESDVFFIEALAKKGKINDTNLSKGESLRLTVHPNEIMYLSAESGAQVRMTNEGQHTVKATCSA